MPDSPVPADLAVERSVNALDLGSVSVGTDSVIYTLGDTVLRAAPAAEIVHVVDGRLRATGIPINLTRLSTYRPVSLKALPASKNPPYTHGIKLSGTGGQTYARITVLS